VDGREPADPHPAVISVRQRRDYRVPSVAALIRVAEAARRSALGETAPGGSATGDDEGDAGPVESVGEAVLELLQAGDGSMGTLDIPELEPLDGVLTVTEVSAPLDLEAFDEEDGIGPFQPGPEDRLVGRLDEHPYVDLTGEGEAADGRAG
jgi:hypothetical protein